MNPITTRERAFTLAAIMVSLLLSALDGTIVATAMPRILHDLNGLSLYTWVVTAYLLASTAMIPIYGKLSDLFGRKVVLVLAVSLFLAGSLLSGMAPSMGALVGFRALQGLGCAGIMSTAFTIAADIFPAAERGKYQGIIGAVFGVSSVMGPWLGGFLTDALSWRWVFYVNMPIGLAALLLILLQMPALKPKLEGKVIIDWRGSITLLVGIVPLLLALTFGGQEYPWGSWQVLGLLAAAAAGIVAFVLVERRAAEPIIPVDLFRNRTFVVGSIASALIAGLATMVLILFLPIYVVIVVGASASGASAMTVMPLMLALVVSSFVSGLLVTRLGRYKGILLAGAALVFVGYLMLQGLAVDTTPAQVTWRMIVLGIGLGPALPILTLVVQNAVGQRQMGAATSSNQFFRQIGSTVGVAVFGTILAATLATQLPRYLPAGILEPRTGSVSVNMSQLQSGNLNAVGDQIRAVTQDTYAKIELALTKGDPAALKSLLDSPQVPAEYKAMLQSGDIAAQVKAGFDPQAPAAAREAAKSALARIKGGLESRAVTMKGEVTIALKRAFTEAIRKVYFWALLVPIAGFLVTLLLPQLPLRKTVDYEPQPAKAETAKA